MSSAPNPEAVLFIAGWWPSPEDPHLGIFIREHALAVQTRQQVVVVHIAVTKEPWRPPRIKWHETEDQGLYVLQGVIQTPARRFGFHDKIVRHAYRMAMARLGRKFRFRFVHLHVRTPVTMNALSVGAERGLPGIVTEHSSFYHVGIDQLPPLLRTRTETRISRWFAQPSIRAVLPVSTDLGRVLQQRFGVPQAKITVVPNVASPLFHPRSPLNNDRFRIVLAARWAEPKDPGLFVDVLHRLPQELVRRLHVTWAGDGAQYAATQHACRTMIEQGIVHFPGRMAKPELAKLLAQAHLLVHPTRAENLPCIIVESLCSGTPVLSMAVNGIPELVHPGNGVLCPPGHPEAFAAALQQIISTYSFNRPLIAADARQRYSQTQVAYRLMAIYESVIS